jgi:hypothetical protein
MRQRLPFSGSSYKFNRRGNALAQRVGVPARLTVPRCARVSGCQVVAGCFPARFQDNGRGKLPGNRAGNRARKNAEPLPGFRLVSCSALCAGFGLSIGGGLPEANAPRGCVQGDRLGTEPGRLSAAGCVPPRFVVNGETNPAPRFGSFRNGIRTKRLRSPQPETVGAGLLIL